MNKTVTVEGTASRVEHAGKETNDIFALLFVLCCLMYIAAVFECIVCFFMLARVALADLSWPMSVSSSAFWCFYFLVGIPMRVIIWCAFTKTGLDIVFDYFSV